MRFWKRPRARCAHLAALLVIGICVQMMRPSTAHAQNSAHVIKGSTRKAHFVWNSDRSRLLVNVGFFDVVSGKVRRKLTRGLPTTIVLTAMLYADKNPKPISTTVQSCRVTWHVWDELYRIDLHRLGQKRTRWTPTIDGVLRTCARAQKLEVATARQAASAKSLYLRARVQVNPIDPAVLQKIKRWVSRPLRTGVPAPGDALFSTFTGLFMKRFDAAERTLEFRTTPAVPHIRAES